MKYKALRHDNNKGKALSWRCHALSYTLFEFAYFPRSIGHPLPRTTDTEITEAPGKRPGKQGNCIYIPHTCRLLGTDPQTPKIADAADKNCGRYADSNCLLTDHHVTIVVEVSA